MSTPLRLRDVSWFFFPLLLNVQLMSVSHSIINAALARLDDYVTAIAAFSVAMVVHLFVASPSYQNQASALALVRGRRSFRAMLLFVSLIAVYVAVMLSLIAFTPLGTWLIEGLLGVKPAIADETRKVLAMMTALPFFTGFRGLFQGIIIHFRRTGLISVATGVRIGALILFLFLGRTWFSGAPLAAFALVACIAVETAFVAWYAWRSPPFSPEEEEKSFAAICRFALPLAFSSGLQQTVPMLINAVISRLPDGTLALAAFGIVRGLLFLLAAPLRNLQQAYIALDRHPGDHSILSRFAILAGGGLALLMFLIALPLNGLVLGDWMGLAADMRTYIAWPLALCALFITVHSADNLYRGILTRYNRTGRIGRATLYKVFVMLAGGGLLLVSPNLLSGVMAGVLLTLIAEIFEAIYLHRQTRFISSLTDGVAAPARNKV